MTNLDAWTDLTFPEPDGYQRAQWAPVYLEPIMGSGERLTIGIAVVSDEDFVVVPADQMIRLHCLYGDAGQGVQFLAEVALEALRHDIAERGVEALAKPTSIMAGIFLGNVSEGSGESIEAIAHTWLQVHSSLVSSAHSLASTLRDSEAKALVESVAAQATDPLPERVAREVVAARPSLSAYFRADIRPDTAQRQRARSHKRNIDFSGSRVVANFCTLNPARPFLSAKDVKTRLWDLKVDRDGKMLPGIYREHELLVFRPSPDDPNYNDKQLSNVSEALGDLEEQADQEDLRMVSFFSVKEMADRILNREAASLEQ